MRGVIWVSMAVLWSWCSAAAAQDISFRNCKATQQELLQSVVPVAAELAARAGASIGDTEEYGRWFGTFSSKYAEDIRSNFKRIHKALINQPMTFICGDVRSRDCADVYAYVYTTEAYVVTLCPDFFDMPRMAGGSALDPDYENGTMEGTIIHEFSHFDVVAGTEDICYSRSDCGVMGQRSPEDAVVNADTYQYFAEDVTFAFLLGAEAPVAEVEPVTNAKP